MMQCHHFPRGALYFPQPFVQSLHLSLLHRVIVVCMSKSYSTCKMKTHWGTISWPPHFYCEPSYTALCCWQSDRAGTKHARIYPTMQASSLPCHCAALSIVPCDIVAMCQSTLRISFLRRLPSSLLMQTFCGDMSFSTVRPPRVVEVLKRLKRVDLQGLHDASEEDRTALEFLVLHNVAMPIDMPRARISVKEINGFEIKMWRPRSHGPMGFHSAWTCRVHALAGHMMATMSFKPWLED